MRRLFGYIVADTASLSPEQIQVYRSYYCGLCRCIGSNFGSTRKVILNYDMTFLILLLSSLYDFSEEHSQRRCVIHPFRVHKETINQATHYAAAMNVLLSYHKCIDDWRDDKAFLRLLLSKLLEKDVPMLRNTYPEKLSVICTCLDELSRMEVSNIQDPDRACSIFGRLLGEIFVCREDRWSDCLRKIGDMLGRYIYLSDAVLDLPHDIKQGKYNPLCSRWSEEFDKEAYVPILKMFLGECTQAFEMLPLVEHTDLLENILYSGVWTRFYRDKHISHKEENHV